ncbi:MAG: hypothetical protein ACEQSR_08605 [Candidatus Methylacidiphilales bacterium]
MPNFEKYEKDLQALIDSAENDIDVKELSKIIASEVYSYIQSNFNINKGIITLDTNTISALQKFTTKLNEAITNEKTYKKSVLNFLTKVKNIGDFQEDFFTKSGTPVSKNELSVGQKIVIDELLSQYTENGINEKVIEPVRKMLRRSILGKEGVKTFSNSVQKLVPQNLQRFNTTTVQAGVDGYQSVINKKLYEKYKTKADAIRVTNTIIATSSPQCRMCVIDYKGEVPINAWPKIFEVAKKNGLIDGTNLDNLAVNKLHWGCRHSFYPIIKV